MRAGGANTTSTGRKRTRGTSQRGPIKKQTKVSAADADTQEDTAKDTNETDAGGTEVGETVPGSNGDGTTPPSVSETSGSSCSDNSEEGTATAEEEEPLSEESPEELSEDSSSSVARNSDGDSVTSEDLKEEFDKECHEDIKKDPALYKVMFNMFVKGWKKSHVSSTASSMSSKTSTSSKRKQSEHTGIWLYKHPDTNVRNNKLNKDTVIPVSKVGEIRDEIGSKLWRKIKLVNQRMLDAGKSSIIKDICTNMKFSERQAQLYNKHLRFLVAHVIGSNRNNTIKNLHNKFFEERRSKDGKMAPK